MLFFDFWSFLPFVKKEESKVPLQSDVPHPHLGTGIKTKVYGQSRTSLATSVDFSSEIRLLVFSEYGPGNLA